MDLIDYFPNTFMPANMLPEEYWANFNELMLPQWEARRCVLDLANFIHYYSHNDTECENDFDAFYSENI